MPGDTKFRQLVEQNHPTGEVIAVNRFLVTASGLVGAPPGSLIYFDNGQQGLLREIQADNVVILNLSGEDIPLGTLAVLESDELTTGVGEALVGRVVSPLGVPLDGKGALNLTTSAPVFTIAPGIIERQALDTQLVSGVAIVDAIFTIVLGQRIAILGDNKSGKSAFLSQLTLSQGGTNRIVVHVLISKRKADVDTLLAKLEASGAIKYTIVVVASVFDSLAQSYIAPYVACAMGEYLWQQGHDVIMIYDDLSNHAKVYRELSLLSQVSPGRDSYPGDMFFAHSSLLERAGRLQKNGATMTALPVVLTPGDDITAFLPTNIMSITDGQIIFDLESFRNGIRPAVNVGLSVSRVGGLGQTKRQKALTGALFKKLAEYRQAAEFSHFGSELALQSKADLELGKKLYEAFRQSPTEIFTMPEQILILSTVLRAEGKMTLNIDSLKRQVKEIAAGGIATEQDYDGAIERLLNANTVQPAAAAAPAAPPPPTTTTVPVKVEAKQ